MKNMERAVIWVVALNEIMRQANPEEYNPNQLVETLQQMKPQFDLKHPKIDLKLNEKYVVLEEEEKRVILVFNHEDLRETLQIITETAPSEENQPLVSIYSIEELARIFETMFHYIINWAQGQTPAINMQALNLMRLNKGNVLTH